MLKGMVAWWARNPVAGNLLMVACVVAGFLSFTRMDKEFWPPGQDDGVTINATWLGASPEDMESQVTVRLEEATTDLDGIKWVRSRSGEGYSWIRLAANPYTDVDALAQDVRSRVEAISGLPPSMEPIRVQRQVFRNWAIMLALHGNVDERVLYDTAHMLRDRISRLRDEETQTDAGTQNVIVAGGRNPEVSIELSETALRQYGLTFDEVARAVRSASVNISAGAVRTDEGDYHLRARNLADTEIDFENIIVRQTPQGAIVRVKDVATVVDGFENVNAYTRTNGEPTIWIAVEGGDRFDIWKASRNVRKFVNEIQPNLPQGLKLDYIFDDAEGYDQLTGILVGNALQGFFLIFLLLLLSLHPRVAFWATVGVMTAFAGSFFILPYAGVSLNFMAVFGFLLVLGIMVDDAIIVGEAIYERAERGETGADMAILATQLVLKPLVASVMVTMLAFLPFMLISGSVQQFTRPISIVVISTLLFSLIESLIILPAHLAHVKKPDPKGDSFMSRLFRAQQKCAHSVLWVAREIHGPMLRFAVKRRWLSLAAFVGVFVLTIGLMASNRIKQTFMPEIEGDFMRASIELPQTTPFSRMSEVADQLDRARLALEHQTREVAYVDPNTGAKSRGVIRNWSQSINENTIDAWIVLTPPETRELRSSAVLKKLEELLGPIPDAERIDISLSGNNMGPNINIALMGENQESLRGAVEELKARLLQFDAVSSVRDSEQAAKEELRFTLLPGAEQMGLTLGEVTRQVRQAYQGEEVQRLPREGNEVRVWTRYPLGDRRTLESLGQFRVRTLDGREVPLASVAAVEFAPGVTGFDRRQRMRSIMVEAETPPEERAKIMQELERDFLPQLDKKYQITRRALGEQEAQKEFTDDLLRYGAMCLFAMFFLLAIVFRSYLQPALIMSVIPFAFIGATVGHYMFGASFALFSWMGMVAAMGVVVNDNVVLVDRVNQIRGYFAMRKKREGAPSPEGDLKLEEISTPSGETWEVVKIAEVVELHEDLIQASIAKDFRDAPIEVRSSKQMTWEKGELREKTQALEAAGFMPMRVRAASGVIEGSISRFRQIFLTSVTEFIGLMPMLLENAAIVQFLKPMAIGLAFGVLFCMPVTLILTPVLYMVGVDIKNTPSRIARFFRWAWGSEKARAVPAE